MTLKTRYAANYERIAHDDLVSELLPSYYRQAQMRKLRSYCGDVTGKRVLDIGAGRGEFLSLIPEADRVAVDIAPSFVRHLIEQGLTTYLADAEDLPFDNEFDVVVMTDILEHVLHPDRAVDSAWRALKIGGRLVVRVPFKEDISVYKPENGCKYEFAHLRSFDRKSLEETLDPFIVRAVHYDGFVAYRPRWLLKWPYRIDNELVSTLTKGKAKGPYIFMANAVCQLPNQVGRLFFRPMEICMVGEKS